MINGLNYSLHYSQYHKYTVEEYKSLTGHYQALLDLLGEKIKPDEKVLDVGCGAGFFLYACNSMGVIDSQGIDISEEQVRQAKLMGLDACCSDTIEYLSLRKGEFDLIVLFDVLEHMEQQQQIDLLGNIYESLKPGGRFIISVPNALSIVGSSYLYDDFTHTRSYTSVSLNFLLANSGFKRVRMPDRVFPKPSWKRAYRLFYSDKYRIHCFTYFYRYLWRKILSCELIFEDVESESLELDLLAVCNK